MLTSLNRQYKDVESHKELAIIDPWFKDKFCIDSEARSNACKMLDECIAEISDDLEEVTQSQKPSRPAILKCFIEILEQSWVAVTGSSSVTEMERYLREPLIDFHRSNTFIWWKENKH